MQKPSEPSTGSIRMQALRLLSRVLDGYKLHPFFYILNLNMDKKTDPPVLPFAHQVELLFRLAFRKPIRILIGDEIGLGKTIEAILVTIFLERRDQIKRVLLLVPRILIEQWRSELKRFGIYARVIEGSNISILAQRGFPDGWYIASIDLVKKGEHKAKITSVNWDVVIVDEAHRVGKTGFSGKSITERYKLVEELASNTTRNIILLSATPHRGHSLDYISRLKLIDPYLKDEKELDNDLFYKHTHNAIIIRRTKMDVNNVYEHKQIFKDARFIARVVKAMSEEEEFNNLLFKFLRDKLMKYYEYIGEEPKALPLLLTLIAKRASSSPYAAMRTLEKILKKRSQMIMEKALLSAKINRLSKEAENIVEAFFGLGFEDYSEAEGLKEKFEPDEALNEFAEKCSILLDKHDVKTLKRLFELVKNIVDHGDSRLKGIFKLIREHINRGDKIVVFTEYVDTAKYIYAKLEEEMPDIVNTTALITSKKIIIPGLREGGKTSIEDLKKYLESGRIKLIISTDVASEGLNLQAVNVVINYEPTWSPIKLEQRLGRIWRLGQEREVTSYTLFLTVRSDLDVLDILYKKLLAWGRSLKEYKLPIGEEVVIDMMTEEGLTAIPIDIAKGVPKYSEYKALLTYIHGGRSGLEYYVQSIINALALLRKDLERVGLTRSNLAFKIEKILNDILGDFRGVKVENLFKELFIITAELKGLKVKIDRGRIFAGTFKSRNVYDFYSNTRSLLEDITSVDKPIYIVSSAQFNNLRELHLFKVIIYFKDKLIYSETVGIGVKAGPPEPIMGRKLLEIITRSLTLDKISGGADEYYSLKEYLKNFEIIASKAILQKVVPVAVKELINYVSTIEKLGFSDKHRDWEPKDTRPYRDKTEYLGAIIFTQPSKTKRGSPPPFKVIDVEKKAMEIAMEYERKSGRIPEDVSLKEHYDILSIDPKSGERRFIEVKGRSGSDLEVELTETEFELAKEKGEKYWLYIVYNIGSGEPKLLAIKDPINNMKWEEITIKRYRFKP